MIAFGSKIVTCPFPSGFGLICSFTVSFYIVLAAGLPSLTPKTWLWFWLQENFPGGPDQFRSSILMGLYTAMIMHCTELAVFDTYAVQFCGIQRWSGLWCSWACGILLEGFPCLLKLKTMLAREKPVDMFEFRLQSIVIPFLASLFFFSFTLVAFSSIMLVIKL